MKRVSSVRELEKLLQRLGFDLVRSKRHNVWRRRSDGATLVVPQSSGDWRTVQNLMSYARRQGVIFRDEA